MWEGKKGCGGWGEDERGTETDRQTASEREIDRQREGERQREGDSSRHRQTQGQICTTGKEIWSEGKREREMGRGERYM